MNHVFIGPEDISIAVMYQGFGKNQNTGLILVNDLVRKAAKTFTMMGVSASEKFDFLMRPYYEGAIGKCIKRKDWDEEICFILYGRIYESYGMSLIRYLRSKFDRCRVVVYLGDMVIRHKFDIEHLKTVSDKVLSFDIGDAAEYGLEWCLEPFSADGLNKIRNGKQKRHWNVSFVGAAKNRYKKIIELYEILRAAGLTCDFHITGVKPKDRLYKDEIGYEYMDFMSLLEHVNCSDCIAEIIQEGGNTPTTRYSEAMLFEKNLLTDCKYFKEKENQAYNIFFFDDVTKLKNWNLEKLRVKCAVETEKYRKLLSIEEMIKTVEDVLK